jgi:hypothetical protein
MSTAQIIEGISHKQYSEIDAEHSGALKKILISPLAYKAGKEQEAAGIDEDKDCLRLGRAIHTATLEPRRFPSQYVCWSGGRRAGKAWDDYAAEAEVSGQTILKEDQLDQAVAISKACRTHPVAGPILAAAGRAELTICWKHHLTGIDLKVRLDWLISGILSDLKSCRDPSPQRFASQAAQLGYHFQLALYADAVAAAGLGSVETKIIAAQSSAPFDVVVYDVPEDVLFIGRQQYEKALAMLVECRDSKKWPGMAPTEEVTLKLPTWADIHEELELTFDGEPMAA